VIDEASFDNIVNYIEQVKKDKTVAEIISGGGYDKSKGYFVEPTVCCNKRSALSHHEGGNLRTCVNHICLSGCRV